MYPSTALHESYNQSRVWMCHLKHGSFLFLLRLEKSIHCNLLQMLLLQALLIFNRVTESYLATCKHQTFTPMKKKKIKHMIE